SAQFYAAIGATSTTNTSFSLPFADSGGVSVLYGDTSNNLKGGIKSTDGGKTWAPFTAQVTGTGASNLILDLITTTGNLLFSIGVSYPNGINAPSLNILMRSTNSGHTWAPLATQPPGIVGGDVFVAPDGTLITATVDTGGGVARLSAGATAWQVLI